MNNKVSEILDKAFFWLNKIKDPKVRTKLLFMSLNFASLVATKEGFADIYEADKIPPNSSEGALFRNLFIFYQIDKEIQDNLRDLAMELLELYKKEGIQVYHDFIYYMMKLNISITNQALVHND